MAKEPAGGGEAPVREPQEAARNLDGGYVIVLRRVWEHPAFKNEAEAAVFVWMISRAQWKPYRLRTKWGSVELGTGEILVAERDLEARFGMGRTRIRALMARMVNENLISPGSNRSPYHAGTVYRITNYETYQSVIPQYEAETEHSVTAGQTDHEPMANPSRTKKNQENQDKQGKTPASQGAKAPRKPLFPASAVPAQADLLGGRVVSLTTKPGRGKPAVPVGREQDLKAEGRAFLKLHCPRISEGGTFELMNGLVLALGGGLEGVERAVGVLHRWLADREAERVSEALEPYLRGCIVQLKRHGHTAPSSRLAGGGSRFGFTAAAPARSPTIDATAEEIA